MGLLIKVNNIYLSNPANRQKPAPGYSETSRGRRKTGAKLPLEYSGIFQQGRNVFS